MAKTSILIKSLKAILNYTKNKDKNTITHIGQDHLGNKYFESYEPGNRFRKRKRFFEPNLDKVPEDILDVSKAPPVWDAWLRFRRDKPPTDEEARESEEYFKYQQALAESKRKDRVDTEKEEAKEDPKILKNSRLDFFKRDEKADN